MTYDEFAELEIGEPVIADIFRFKNFHPVKTRETVPIKFKSTNTAHIEFEKQLIEFHFSQLELA
jgi:hypothetical protein